jgi:hypothetical protein
MGPRDPRFVTPLIKRLLNKQNRLRRQGNFAASGKLAERINRLTADFRGKQCLNSGNTDFRDLWATVKRKSRYSDVAK